MSTDERRMRVLRAVVAVFDHCEQKMGGGQPVRAFHVRYFGIAECVENAATSTITSDLRWLARHNLLLRPDARRASFLPTEQGRAWLAEHWR